MSGEEEGSWFRMKKMMLAGLAAVAVGVGYGAVYAGVNWLHDASVSARPAFAPLEPSFIDAQSAAMSYTVLVNPSHVLPSEYEPSDLTAPDIPFIFDGYHEKRLLREAAARAAEQLFQAADKENIELFGVSGYRSYDTQAALYAYSARTKGAAHAARYSALPGKSEHQTGLALDVTSRSVGLQLVDGFGDTREGIWLSENAHRFGFVIRYPGGKEHITGYAHEPWHIRYVGNETAAAAHARGITLEELAEAAPVSK